MSKAKRLDKAYRYLFWKELINEKRDISLKMNINYSSVSSAFSGNEKYLTDSFITNFCKTFQDINPNWFRTGEGEMLRANYNELKNLDVAEDANHKFNNHLNFNEMKEMLDNYKQLVVLQKELIDDLKSENESLKIELASLNKQIQKEG